MIALGQPLCWTNDQSACQPGGGLMHCEEPLRFFDLRNFGSYVEADEGRNQQFAGDVIPTGRLSAPR